MTTPQNETLAKLYQIAESRKAAAEAKKAALEAEAKPRASNASNDSSAADEDRLSIDYAPENLHIHEREAVDALASKPGIFARGAALGRLAGEGDETSAGPLERSAASPEELSKLAREPRVVELTRATLRVELAKRVVVREADRKKDGSIEWKCVRAPDDLVKAVHERGSWPTLPELVAVAETPFLRPDGSICATPGFDAATGTFLTTSGAQLAIPETPSREDARVALESLEEVFVDFPFVSRAHGMVPIAAILTLLARPAISGNVPALMVDACTPGTGKTVTIEAVSLIARGRTSPKLSWPPNEEELSKVLSASAIRGASLVNFDNVASGFGGASLDKCLTANGSVEFRVLGASEMRVLPWHALIVASGNNLVIMGDTTRRVLVSRLESKLENPEDRTDFRHPNLLAWVASNRARLVSAALTVLRAFVVAGRPSMGLRPWGSFESFAELIPQALVWAGGEDCDIMKCRPEVSGAVEPEKAALLAVLDGWPRLFGTNGGTAKGAISLLYPADRLRGGPQPPDGFDELRDAFESVTNARPGIAPTPHSVGRFLQRVCGRVAEGRRLNRRTDRKGFTLWSVEELEQRNRRNLEEAECE